MFLVLLRLALICACFDDGVAGKLVIALALDGDASTPHSQVRIFRPLAIIRQSKKYSCAGWGVKLAKSS
jgi:hypothetical protein